MSMSMSIAVVVVWHNGNVVGRISEVTLRPVRRAGLVLRWMTVLGYTVLVAPIHPSHPGQLSLVIHACLY